MKICSVCKNELSIELLKAYEGKLCANCNLIKQHEKDEWGNLCSIKNNDCGISGKRA
jgi:hypothetical protein